MSHISSSTVYTGPTHLGAAVHRMGSLLREGASFFYSLTSGNKIIMRREVPIERWFMDNLEPFQTESEEWSARGYALIAALEGVVRIVAAAVSLLFTSYISQNVNELQTQQAIFKAQIQGFWLGLNGILSPNRLKQHIDQSLHSNEEPIIGCRQGQLHWGTAYAPSSPT